MPKIDLYLDQRLCSRIRFDESRTVLVGRGDDCDIQLPDRRVSRRHLWKKHKLHQHWLWGYHHLPKNQ